MLPNGQRSALLVHLDRRTVDPAAQSYVGNWYSNHLGPSGRKRQTPGRSNVSTPVVVTTLVILLMLMFSKFVYTASLSSFLTFYLMEKFRSHPPSIRSIIFSSIFLPSPLEPFSVAQ